MMTIIMISSNATSVPIAMYLFGDEPGENKTKVCIIDTACSARRKYSNWHKLLCQQWTRAQVAHAHYESPEQHYPT